ncbi:hypothetical protein ABTY98_01440 [Streptomyces sp. NPDC096040]|uniref:hypothetical protein n=1 Tax=Streptomyces sp. NPDC096040 TaxID=3155541 RepID=UPI00332EAB70
MGDSAVWVAALTGGTAVPAGWVTNRVNARAARVQAEASARAQQLTRARELRRAAYADFMGQAHANGELYWKADFFLTAGPGVLPTSLDGLRAELRSSYDLLLHSVRIVALEGPATAAEAAQAVLEAATRANRALYRHSVGEADARARFDEARQGFTRCLEEFVEVARAATETS